MAKDQLMTFSVGVVGLFVLIGLSIHYPCLHPKPTGYVTIGIGLMSALIAAQVPGLLQVNLAPGKSTKVKATGAIAMFLLVVFVKPLLLGETEADDQFAKQSCQGPVPTGTQLPKSALPPDLNPASARVDSAVSAGRPTRFRFDYPFGEFAGTRDWTQVKEGVWIESYPNNQLFTAFRETERVKGVCNGIIVERQDASGFQIYIPDKSCANKQLLWRTHAGAWSLLGEMKDVT